MSGHRARFAWTPGRGPALQTAGGPSAVPVSTPRPQHRAVAAVAVIANLSWLTCHLLGGLCWYQAFTRASALVGHTPDYDDWATYPYRWGPDAQIDLWISRADQLAPWLLMSFPIMLVLWRWLPRRGASMLAWIVLWAVGMLLWRGFGAMAIA